MNAVNGNPRAISSQSAALFLLMAALIGALASHLGESDPRLAGITGEITEPADNATVSAEVLVRGRLSAELPIDTHLWLAIRHGELMWPRAPEVPVVDTHWELAITEEAHGPYSIVLFVVAAEGHNALREWVRNGEETGHWPGFGEIPGKELDAVSVRTKGPG